MPTLNVYDLTVLGATKEDLEQWCSHHLSNRFRIWTEPVFYSEQTEAQKQDRSKPAERVKVHVIGNKDRFRLRDAYDIAATTFGRQYFSDDEYVER